MVVPFGSNPWEDPSTVTPKSGGMKEISLVQLSTSEMLFMCPPFLSQYVIAYDCKPIIVSDEVLSWLKEQQSLAGYGGGKSEPLFNEVMLDTEFSTKEENKSVSSGRIISSLMTAKSTPFSVNLNCPYSYLIII